MSFTHYRQADEKDCGPTCLRMIAKHYGRTISLEKLRKLSEVTREGSSLLNLSDAAEHIGFRSIGVQASFCQLAEATMPSIVLWNENHYVVLYKVKNNTVYIADPAQGLLKYTIKEFIHNWIGPHANPDTEDGIALIVEPTPKLSESAVDDIQSHKGFSFLYQYLFRYKKFLFQLIIGLFAGSLLQILFPFLTQSVVDIGIQNQDLHFIYLILIAQLLLFLGKTGIEFIRGWILLHLSTRINISILSDFFVKLMNLPIAFFDSKMTGDIMQRIDDHQRIEQLLTTDSLNVLFSVFNIFIFGAVLAWYDLKIFLIFLTGSILYFVWIFMFLKKRRELDYKRFSYMSDEQSKVMELINGMQEIKLHNAEKQKRWGWEFLQARLFKISVKNLSLEQTLSIGSSFIHEIQNILIIFLSATLVIKGEITLGMMMSISYIVGQLNSPIQQLMSFIFSAQDAKITLERLSEIHNKEDEESIEEGKINEVPVNSDFRFKNVSFRYTGSSEEVIQGLDLTIPANKITAIVGGSGSGKTTLMKLLLKFYEPTKGEIKIDEYDLKTISQTSWRAQCGVVMQEGFIFNDTIAKNIALGENQIDHQRLRKAVEIANIKDFIGHLPLGYNTKIGQSGIGISGGEKQRILIARAVYKNPRFIFFDEATSALDSKNERIIMENLNGFFKERTAVVIAHRLSTVKNADQIIVLDNGKIIEHGTHKELVSLKGSYYSLVKNQLELDDLSTKTI